MDDEYENVANSKYAGPTHQLVNTATAASLLGITQYQFEQWQAAGLGPPVAGGLQGAYVYDRLQLGHWRLTAMHMMRYLYEASPREMF